MMNYSTIFWDSLWYFKLNNLEYDFMQPYYYKLEDIKPSPDITITLDEISKISIIDNRKEEYKYDISGLQICNFNFTI